MSSLADRLRARIQSEGPISFRDWMQAALYDESDGYYCRPDRVRQGRGGDYRTAPETSSLFAATLANYFSRLFTKLGAPNAFTILEVGAGSGEFARGVLTTLRSQHPEVFEATSYVIEEIGPTAGPTALLSEFQEKVTVRSPSVSEGNVMSSEISNLRSQTDRAEGPSPEKFTGVVFSNELIDAFPIHRVVLREGIVRELYVAVDEQKFVWIECEPAEDLLAHLESNQIILSEGQIAEINLRLEEFVRRSSAFLERGFVISVDYGAERRELQNDPARHAGTLRGFQRHQMVEDVLASPGEVDLTSTIDWTQMKTSGELVALRPIRFEPLDKFLLAEGLLDELERLTGNRSDAAALRLRTGAREMIMPHGLAASFQVLVQEKVSDLESAQRTAA